jgi:hypothetical protein
VSEVSFDVSSLFDPLRAFTLGSLPVLGLTLPYSVLQSGGEYNVWGMVAGVPTQITGHTDGGPPYTSDEILFPVLSPNETRILYRMQRISDGAETLYGLDLAGESELVVLTTAGHRVMHPMWHPDSNQVVYARGENFAFGGSIWTTDFSGATPVNVYMPSPLGGSTGYYAFRPSFNYDGSKIAFWLERNTGTDGSEGLYVMDADGSNVTQIVAATGPYRSDGQQYAWANGSDKLVYEYLDDVVVINGDGTGATTISVGDTASQLCRVSKYAWSEDDSLVYASSRWFDGSVFRWTAYSLEADGGGAVRLNDLHGPHDAANFRSVFRSWVDDRLYFIETQSPGKLASIATDGSDYTVEHLLTTGSIGTDFFVGTGFEFV